VSLQVRRVGLDRLPVCLGLRRQVFIDEQGVPEEEEVDGLDPLCAHFLAEHGGRPVGTARLWETPDGRAKAQRVAVLRDWRGQGVGAALMAALEAEARARGHAAVVLGAQLEAVPFYERLGYAPYGEVFLDAGIAHRMMRRGLR
jgi:predicted GNAT family N-acyltransferase